MGFFSWKTCDTGKPITNVYSVKGALPVWILLPDGSKYCEQAYEGYGEFAGLDFYTELARHTLPKSITEEASGEQLRDYGLTLEFRSPRQWSKKHPELKTWADNHGKRHIKRPKFAEKEGCKWEDLPNPENDPNQGYF